MKKKVAEDNEDDEIPHIPNREKVDLIYEELEKIRAAHRGVLEPIHVVNHAAKPDSILHDYFEWDNTKAAQEYRLSQARKIIRVCVTVDEVTKEKTRVYVSLESDRGKNGYRALAEVLENDEQTEELLQQALKDLNHFREKYRVLEKLTEIKPIFENIEVLIGKAIYKKEKPKKVATPNYNQ